MLNYDAAGRDSAAAISFLRSETTQESVCARFATTPPITAIFRVSVCVMKKEKKNKSALFFF